MKTIKISIIQQKYKNSKEETIVNTVSEIEENSKNGAQLIILQELHQHQYFCQSHNIKFFDYADSWQDDIKFWGKIAKQYSIVLVSSLFEKEMIGVYYNTAVIFDSNGKLAGKYRKNHIPEDPFFHEKFYFKNGNLGFKPIETTLGKLGVLICWDQWFPEASRLMAQNGADILIYPTAIGWLNEDSEKEKKKQLDSWITIQKSHAIANGIPVISCNRVGYESHPTIKNKGITFWGNSFICDNRGDILCQANENREETITCDISLDKNIRNIWPFFRDMRCEIVDF